MAQSPFEIKKEICDVGKRIYDHGFVAANDGNISVKVGPNEFYCTPTGVSKGYMTPDMIIRIDGQGNKIDGKLNPSSEIKMHLRCYKERDDVNGVVHAHPPTATGYAVARVSGASGCRRCRACTSSRGYRLHGRGHCHGSVHPA